MEDDVLSISSHFPPPNQQAYAAYSTERANLSKNLKPKRVPRFLGDETTNDSSSGTDWRMPEPPKHWNLLSNDPSSSKSDATKFEFQDPTKPSLSRLALSTNASKPLILDPVKPLGTNDNNDDATAGSEKKPRKPMAKLDPTRLRGPQGLGLLRKRTQGWKPKGRGKEVGDMLLKGEEEKEI
jgi:hypothetical protein